MLCFRLHFAKDTTIGNTAGATVRQLVSLVFERVVIEDASSNEEPTCTPDLNSSNSITEFVKLTDSPVKALKPFAQDAFSLFQVQSKSLIIVFYPYTLNYYRIWFC